MTDVLQAAASPSKGAAPQSEPDVYPARLVLGVVCDHCGAGHAVTIGDPDRGGAGWAEAPDRCRNGCGPNWRVMAVPGDGSETQLSASWEPAAEARFPSGFNPFRDEQLPERGPRAEHAEVGDLEAER